MTSVESYKCIFCSAEFHDKELLQEHFRKHGDPEFKKTKLQNEVPTSTEKSEECELVGCDVCEEQFQTISKAITHKHKVHPDHDAKYFCPWCGKLFTMKHLYNKHIKTSHNGQANSEVKDYHCDRCSVYFYVPSAMLHHNKFFHRQDIEMNTLGSSKKVRMCNQELVSILYCPFCGEEYNNKVNLDKHMEDDHADENQSPEEILRCPLCEAILYHLDAYELHLTFHSTEDIYSEPNEMVTEITEFSLEAVPPLMEKVEDANDSVNDLLKMFMDGGETSRVKSKKHKKHKKSKKETITLDEFLNMNKDVFGDGLNVQGIEEVPTQMVLKKKYKSRKTENTSTVKHDLAKLKKQGIVIKSNSTKVVPNTSTIIQTNETLNQDEITSKANTSQDPNDVISKLMGQGNSQIKIVKTSVKPDSDTKQDSYQSSKVDSSSDYNKNVTVERNENSENTTITNESLRLENTHAEEYEEEKAIENTLKPNASPEACPLTDEEIPYLPETPDHNSPGTDFHNIGSGLTIKSISKAGCENIDDTASAVQDKAEDSEEEKPEDNSEDDNIVDEQLINPESCKKVNTLQSLNLNKGITIKPIVKTLPPPTLQSEPEREHTKDSSLHKPLSTLKGLSKHITVKPSSVSPLPQKHPMTEENIKDDTTCNIHDEAQVLKESEIPSKQSVMQSNADILKRLTNVTAKPVSPKTLAANIPLRKDINMTKTPKNVNVKSTMENDVEIFHIEDSDSDADIDHCTKRNPNSRKISQDSVSPKPTFPNFPPQAALRGLNKNITVKSMSQQSTKCTEVLTKDGQQEFKKMSITRTFESKNVNVTNDSNKLTEDQTDLQKTLNNLKHVTIKPKNSLHTNYKEEPVPGEEDEDFNSDHFEDDSYNSDVSAGKVEISEINADETSELENPEDAVENNVNVESPPESPHSPVRNADDNFDDFDIEAQIKATPIKKNNQPDKSDRQQNPSSYLNLNKELTIKPAKKMQDETQIVESSDISKNVQPSIPKPASQRQQINRNAVQSQKATSSNEVNTVKTVKTYQSQTVIEEVTTTVTKTIRTVNTQEVKKASQTKSIRPQRPSPRNPNQGTATRQASFVGAKVRNCSARPVMASSSNALVPTRPRLPNPQMPSPCNVRKSTPVQNRPRGPITTSTNRPRVAPPAAKRPADEVGHFSCFKKPKESLYPVAENEDVQYSMRSKSTFSNVVQKGGSQTRSETNSQQSITKLSGVSGLTIVKSKQQIHVEEKCEVPPPKNSTMAALEKLQKQGLLIKKPRLEVEAHSENDEVGE